MAHAIAEVSPSLRRAIITLSREGSPPLFYTFEKGRITRVRGVFSPGMFLQPSWGSECLQSDEGYPFRDLRRQIRIVWKARAALDLVLRSIDPNLSEEQEGFVRRANAQLRDLGVFNAVRERVLIAGRQPGFDWDAKRAGKVGELLKAVWQVPPTHVPP